MGTSGDLFFRVATILEQARGSVRRAINTDMVLAYWCIGREITHDLQGGEARAEYGKQIIADLSGRLTKRFGTGFSERNLWDFRQFYQAYAHRFEILRPSGAESSVPIRYPSGSESTFSPHLTWSHYRALMRVANDKARAFYEQEAIECGWSKVQLERQIHTAYYERIVANHGDAELSSPSRKRLSGDALPVESFLKSPLVLEFLGLPDPANLHENDLEQAIINNLQTFLLELGKGFSFVARQKHIRFDDEDFYIDLVFYNFMLKCFLLIDLKIGKLSHQDVGQMDGYVRLFEDRFKVTGDNPTIGLILCSDKGEAVAKYSVLSESRQIFASKYLQFLPSEQELQTEIVKERRLIENRRGEME
ncbi:MAG: PDDEXK nuclease domain-containing protein [Zoogloeaceae bacterium]|nr:PDDEXK nuclease domain-containing protein [Zoogloeaceae bacterium]